MPIDRKDVRTNVVEAGPGATVREVLRRLPPERAKRSSFYVVVPDDQGHYLAVRWAAVERIAADAGSSVFDVPLAALEGLPAPVPAVEFDSLTPEQARTLRDQQPARCIVVLENGTVLGVFAQTGYLQTASAQPPVEDPFAAEEERELAESFAPDTSSAVLGIEQQERVINAWVDGLGKDEPLELKKPYRLSFNVDLPREDARATAGGVDALFESLPPDQDELAISVIIVTSDFALKSDAQQTLNVPREGPSWNTATFTIVPAKNGAGLVTALFLANGRMFQQMAITLQVGKLEAQTKPVVVKASGKTLASGAKVAARPQSIDLVIIKKDAGYEFILQGNGVKRAQVNLSEAQIADLIFRARDELKKIVYIKSGNQYAYQSADTNIAPEIHEATLKALCGVGFDLFEALFFAPGSGADAQEMGNLLRQRSQHTKLHIAIIAERFFFPWALLYDRDYDPDNVEPEGFWGFKHVIEYTPEFRNATLTNFTPEISVADTLELGFVCNTTIDDELKRKGFQGAVVQPQRDFLKRLAGVSVTEYPTGADFFKLLNNLDGTTQLIYFYCHAESALPGAPGGVDASKVLLSDGPVLLQDMKRRASLGKGALKSCPLVFLNACESAELSPYLYDGLVPYLIAKGARGVIGTEVNTPALFAAEFAQTFLERFTAGNQPLGELLLAMRREYLHDKHNVMGLVYALHSGGDVVVQRGP